MSSSFSMNYQAQRLSSQSPITRWLFPNPSEWYRLGFGHQDATSDRGHGSLGNLEEALVRAFQIDDQDGHAVEQPDRAPVKNPLLQHPYRQAFIHAQAPVGKPKAAPALLPQSETPWGPCRDNANPESSFFNDGMGQVIGRRSRFGGRRLGVFIRFGLRENGMIQNQVQKRRIFFPDLSVYGPGESRVIHLGHVDRIKRTI